MGISDADSANFDGGQLSILFDVGGSAEDQLSIQSSGNISFDGTDVTYAGVGIIATVNTTHNGINGASLILDFSSLATAARLTEMLANLTYQNTSNTPTTWRTLSMTLSDGDGGSSFSQIIDLRVNAENDAPTVANAVADQNADAGEQSSFTFASNTFNDVDGDTLTYSVTLADNSSPAWLSIDSATRTVYYDPVLAGLPSFDIKIIANDGNGGTVVDTVTSTSPTPALTPTMVPMATTLSPELPPATPSTATVATTSSMEAEETIRSTAVLVTTFSSVVWEAIPSTRDGKRYSLCGWANFCEH